MFVEFLQQRTHAIVPQLDNATVQATTKAKEIFFFLLILDIGRVAFVGVNCQKDMFTLPISMGASDETKDLLLGPISIQSLPTFCRIAVVAFNAENGEK